MVKRIFLFLVVNILVVLTISLTLNLLGIRPYLTQWGIDYESLLAFCAIVGFGGAFVSLALSKVMAKWMMGVKVINPTNPGSQTATQLLQTVHRLAQKAGLPGLPEVGVYESPEINAFATGPSKGNALVAVSTGLLNSMKWEEVEGVLGHEISHVANGDMVTMTLLQGIVNTFVMFFARVAAWGVNQAMSGDRDDDRGPNPFMYMITVFIFEIFFSILGSIVVNYFSRRREFRADAGSARIGGREKMIHALEALKRHHEEVDGSHPSLQTLKINGGTRGLGALFATHPDLDTRINALRNLAA